MQGDDQWRVESRDAGGNVQGSYMYKTPEGQVVLVSYESGPQGYRAKGDAIPGGAAPLEQVQQKEQPVTQGLAFLRQDQQQQALGTRDQSSNPYGALLLREIEKTRPSGDGVHTFSDDSNLAVITDIRETENLKRPSAVYPLVFLPGTSEQLVGPPLVDDEPVLPGVILV